MSEAITVCVPVFDGEATIERAVRSTLRALPATGRVLVHDDASTDRTPEVLATIDDPRLEVVRSESNRGVVEGANLLLRRVETPLVARIDGDDVTLPWRFALQRRALRRADVVFATVGAIGDVGPPGVRPGPPLPVTPDAMPLHLLLSNPVAASTMLARTEVVAEHGYRATTAEDYDLWLRLAASGRRIARIAAPTVLYRFHATQLTAAPTYRTSAFTHPLLHESYAALSQRVLGLEPTWFAAWHGVGGGPDDAEQRAIVAAAVRSAARGLRPDQRALLELKLRGA